MMISKLKFNILCLPDSLTHKELNRDIHGRFLSEHFDKPFIDFLEVLTSDLRDKMLAITQPARDKRRLSSK